MLWLKLVRLCADGEWIVRVFVVPLVAVIIAALRYAYVVRKRPDAAEDAAGSFRSSVFFIVFIVYRESTYLDCVSCQYLISSLPM